MIRTMNTGGRPRGVRDWDREPYRAVPTISVSDRVKISTTVDRVSLERFHDAARAASISMSYLLDEIAGRLQVDEETGAITLDGRPIASPRRAQEALGIPA